MKIEVFSASKYKADRREGDDIALCLPGRLYAVFDGATDALGTRVNGESVGRIAARTVADVFLATALDPVLVAAEGSAIIKRAEAALGAVNAELKLPIPASTTIAAVFDRGDTFRLLILGDSAVRINGTRIISRLKIIDDVSSAARIAIFRILRRRIADPDQLERQTRQAILLGLTQAVETGLLSSGEAERVVADVIAMPRHVKLAEDIRAFLHGGIRSQYTHANNPGSALGYASMNGTRTDLRDLTDITLTRNEVHTLELYTDGYFSRPMDVSVAAWEREFNRIERADFHKINRFRAVKGSTTTEFSDDRSVICLTFDPKTPTAQRAPEAPR